VWIIKTVVSAERYAILVKCLLKPAQHEIRCFRVVHVTVLVLQLLCFISLFAPYFVRVKVKVTLEQATKAQKGSRAIAYSFLNLGTRWRWVVSTTPRPLYSLERPGTHCTGGRVGPRAGLDGCKKSQPYRDSISRPSSP
jgi:hypothetical protein